MCPVPSPSYRGICPSILCFKATFRVPWHCLLYYLLFFGSNCISTISANVSYKKVNCTLVQALRLCTGHTAHRRSRGIALPFLNHKTRRGWGVRVTPRPLFTPGKDPVPIVQEAGWVPGPVWTGAENLGTTGIRSPDRPDRSQLLYRLRYPPHRMFLIVWCK